MPSIKGTASVIDERARDKELKSTKWPKVFKKKVEIRKINREVMTQWIEKQISQLLGFEDEIVAQTAINLFFPTELEGVAAEPPDPKRAQLDLQGFLGDDAAKFTKECWTLMVEASESVTGIPQTLLEEKKQQLAIQKKEAENAAARAAAASAPIFEKQRRQREEQEATRRRQQQEQQQQEPSVAVIPSDHHQNMPAAHGSVLGSAQAPAAPTVDQFGRAIPPIAVASALSPSTNTRPTTSSRWDQVDRSNRSRSPGHDRNNEDRDRDHHRRRDQDISSSTNRRRSSSDRHRRERSERSDRKRSSSSRDHRSHRDGRDSRDGHRHHRRHRRNHSRSRSRSRSPGRSPCR